MPVRHVLLVSFHHRNGPQIDYAVPQLPPMQAAPTDSGLDVSNEVSATAPVKTPAAWSFLPFICLPDGAHEKEEEMIYFQLPPVPEWADMNYNQNIFGTACFRQIPANDLIEKSDDVTRNRVQKAVVVLTDEPIHGAIRPKLEIATQALFDQKDFSKLDVLDTLYKNLNQSFNSSLDESVYLQGLPLRELVSTFESKTLQILKLILLEKRILFYGQDVTRLCGFQYGLLSLIPDFLPTLSSKYSSIKSQPQSMDTNITPGASNRSRFAFPLHVIDETCLFQPYIPLIQMDEMKSKRFIVGSTNAIILNQKGLLIDVVINTDTGAIQYRDSSLQSMMTLSSSDREFMEELNDAVLESWRGEDDIETTGTIETFVRTQFEHYLMSLLVTVKASLNPPEDVNFEEVGAWISSFNLQWINAWQRTRNFEIWNDSVSSFAFADLKPGHIRQDTSGIASVTNHLSEIGRSMGIAPLQENIGRALATAESSITKLVSDAETHAKIKENFGKVLVNAEQSIETAIETVESSMGKAMNIAENSIGKAYSTLTDPEQHKKIQESANQFFTSASSWISASTSSWWGTSNESAPSSNDQPDVIFDESNKKEEEAGYDI